MNVTRVNMTSFGTAYEGLRQGTFRDNAYYNGSDSYRLNVLYDMLKVVRDEQKEQAEIIVQNQVVLRNMLSDMARDNGKYHDDEFYANDVYEISKHRINTIA